MACNGRMLYTEVYARINVKHTTNIWHGMAECSIQMYMCVLMYKIPLTYGIGLMLYTEL